MYIARIVVKNIYTYCTFVIASLWGGSTHWSMLKLDWNSCSRYCSRFDVGVNMYCTDVSIMHCSVARYCAPLRRHIVNFNIYFASMPAVYCTNTKYCMLIGSVYIGRLTNRGTFCPPVGDWSGSAQNAILEGFAHYISLYEQYVLPTNIYCPCGATVKSPVRYILCAVDADILRMRYRGQVVYLMYIAAAQTQYVVRAIYCARYSAQHIAEQISCWV